MLRIEEVGPEKAAEVAGLWNASFALLPISASEMERQMRFEAPLTPRAWIAFLGSEPAGLGLLERNVGSFHPLKWVQYTAVRPNSRGQGIGQALWQQAIAGIPEPPLAIESRVREDDPVSLRFAERRGFVEVKRDFESELRLDDVAAEPSDLPGVRFCTLSECDSLEMRRSFYELWESVRADIPRTDPPSPLGFDFFVQEVVEHEESELKGLQLAFVGDRLAGFSTVFRSPEVGRLDQGLTAVGRDFRGRGIAQALKRRVVAWAKQNGYERIRTDNDTRNTPMLAINEKLGFRRLVGMVTVRWEPSR